MVKIIKDLGRSITDLFFPHYCLGCGTDIINNGQIICLRCHQQLPVTNFQHFADNPVEKIFWGRMPLFAAASHFYFSKKSVLQQLLHQLKYKGNKEVGFALGEMMGAAFIQSSRFSKADGLIALPLFPSRERKRGYNQAAVICQGFSSASGIPFVEGAVSRKKFTHTQTQKNRIERWQNMEGRFEVVQKEALINKKLILVDDVVTTGATLEACGQELLKVTGVQLGIATLAYTVS